MIACAFDEDNGVMGTPQGCDPDQIPPLSVFRGFNEYGAPVVISCWKPTPEEWEEMQRTGRVWLVVLGGGMPPVHVRGTSPFVKSEGGQSG